MLDSQPEPAQQPARSRAAIVAALVALVLLVYAPALENGFVNLDDNVYVTGNPMVLQGLEATTLAWAATANVASNWHPLTMLSHMTDVELFGLEPRGHHLTSIMLHALNTVLLFIVLRRMTGQEGRSLVVALLFAVHPTRVESVAWVAERKDVLSTAFWLLTMLAYGAWHRRPSRRRYGTICVLLALGLMAKPMLVTLPCVLLLLDAWPLRRIDPTNATRLTAWWPLVREKLPLFAIVVAFCVIAVATQGTAIEQVEARPLDQRIANAAHSYVWYAVQTVVPHGLAVYYPFQDPGTLRPMLAAGVLVAISLVLVSLRRRAPWAAVGWFWYLGSLVPVIGFLPVGGQARADRFTYVPTIGLLIIVAWGAHALLARARRRSWIAGAATAAAVLALAGTTRAQIAHWHSSETLFRRALAVTENNEVAHLNLAEALSAHPSTAHRDEALEHYAAALALDPGKAAYHAALGSALSRFGRPRDAQGSLVEAVRLAPKDPRMHHALAMVLDDLAEHTTARDHLERAVALDPGFAPALHGLAAFHDARGEHEQAIPYYRQALENDPGRALRGRLGVLIGQQGALDEAADLLTEAARRNPQDPTILFNLGVTHAQRGDLDRAVQSLRVARDLAPNDPRIAAMLQRVEAQRPPMAP